MTLVPYDHQQLDQLALRLLDLSARARSLASSSREQGLTLELNDRKSREWLERLEEWLLKSVQNQLLFAELILPYNIKAEAAYQLQESFSS